MESPIPKSPSEVPTIATVSFIESYVPIDGAILRDAQSTMPYSGKVCLSSFKRFSAERKKYAGPVDPWQHAKPQTKV